MSTTKPLAVWGEVLHDPDLAEAIVDRILERGRFLVMDGPSLRTRHIDQDHLSDPARVSGKSRPEFPELTIVGLRYCQVGHVVIDACTMTPENPRKD